MLNKFLLIAGLILFCNLVLAQSEKKNTIDIVFGGSNFHILDKHATELIYRGTGIAPSIDYKHSGLMTFHKIEGKFYYNNLFSTSDNFKTIIITGQLRYSLLRTLLKTEIFNNQFYLSVGGAVGTFFSKYDYKFYMKTFWANSIKSWYGIHSVDIAMNIGYSIENKHKLDISLFIPIVCNVARPDYSSSGNFNFEKNDWEIKLLGNNRFISDNLIFNTRICYVYDLTNILSLKSEYEFYYAKSKYPDLLKLYMNNLRIGIRYNFYNRDKK